MSDFTGIQIALTGLIASRRALDTTGHNVANATTEGYSRQRVETAALSGSVTPAFWSKYPEGGLGVRVTDISRARNLFLDARAYAENGRSAFLQRTQYALNQIQTTFAEPGEDSIQTRLSEMWSGFDDIANNPGDLAARSQLLQRAATVSDSIRTAAGTITGLRTSGLEELRASIDEVNTLSTSIATLNDAIQTAHVGGLSANDLLDQRDEAINRLSALINVTTRAGGEGQIDVYTDGGTIVRGNTSEPLILDASQPTIVVRWQKDNYPSTQAAGKIGGLLAQVNDVYPRYLRGLDDVATELRDTTNAAHGVMTGGWLAPAQQDMTGLTMRFDLTLNGVALPTAVFVAADYSGAGGAAALQSAVTTAINNPAVTVKVTGGDGTPMTVKIQSTDPNDVLTLAPNGANPGWQLFENSALSSSVPVSAQDQSAAAGPLQFRLRLNGGGWTTVSVPAADYSGAGGAAALKAALVGSVPPGVDVSVIGGNGTTMRIAFAPSAAGATLEATEVGTPPNQDPGYGLLLSDVPMGLDRIGGRQFFTGTDAGSFAVDPSLLANPDRLAAAKAGNGTLDGANALAMAGIGARTSGPDSSYRSFIVGLGVEAQTVNRRVSIQAATTTAIDEARKAESGVNIDEEMINMVQFQQAYAAAARYLTAVDEALSTLISNTGAVGR